ncbi:MAG: ribokinase [Thermogutta sp.]|nr:ribokinase [Thermogutta sp.]
MNTPHVVVVGSSNTDMVVKTAHLPKPGETVVGGTFVMAAGGKGANQAVAAARLGARTTFIAKVGDDLFGRQAVEGYQREGIDTRCVLRDAERPTGVALILVDERGENLISVASGANESLSPEDIDGAAEVIRSADIVVMQLEIPLPTVCRAAEIAAAAGVPVILDPAPAPSRPLPDDLLRHVTYLKPNESEAERLTGVAVADADSAQAAADRLLASGPRAVIVTLGARGALVVERPGEGVMVPPHAVSAVDTTAAGDAFSGALAVALARGESLLDAARFAAVAGALAASRMGAQPSLPTEAEVRAARGA